MVQIKGTDDIPVQVVQDTLLSTFTTTSQTDVSTGLSVTITPRSLNSKILIIAKVDIAHDNVAAKVALNISRNGNPLFIGDANGNRQRISTAYYGNYNSTSGLPSSMVYLDTPGQSTAQTYEIKMRRLDPQGTVGINRGIDEWTDSTIFATSASSLVAIEFAS